MNNIINNLDIAKFTSIVAITPTTITMNYPKGTILKGSDRQGLKQPRILEDTELLTEAGSCGEDEFLYHWRTQDGRLYLTTDIELAGLLADGAELTE